MISTVRHYGVLFSFLCQQVCVKSWNNKKVLIKINNRIRENPLPESLDEWLNDNTCMNTLCSCTNCVRQLHCQTLATVTLLLFQCKGIYPRHDTEKMITERTKKIIATIAEDTILKIFDPQGTSSQVEKQTCWGMVRLVVVVTEVSSVFFVKARFFLFPLSENISYVYLTHHIHPIHIVIPTETLSLAFQYS